MLQIYNSSTNMDPIIPAKRKKIQKKPSKDAHSTYNNCLVNTTVWENIGVLWKGRILSFALNFNAVENLQFGWRHGGLLHRSCCKLQQQIRSAGVSYLKWQHTQCTSLMLKCLYGFFKHINDEECWKFLHLNK